MTELPVNSAEEIELIDFMRVIWKWKYLIAVGTLLFSVIAGIVSMKMTKVYRVDMILAPGILRMHDSGKHAYIDSPGNIRALIEEGTFDEKIFESISSEEANNLPKTVAFGIDIPRNSNTLSISYRTSNIDQGIRILESLGKLLRDRYDELVKYYQADYETEIKKRQTTIENSKAALLSHKEKIKNIQKRIDSLKSEIDLINKNTISLIKERDKLLEQNNPDNILASILYTNTIQQNLTLANTYKNEIKGYKDEKENQKVKLETTQNNIKQLFEDIKDLQFKRQSIQNIQILQPPISSPFPIKPKKKRNVIFATMLGLFTMVFLAFFLEYIARHKTIKKD
jgi:uncharacterized protein involved in exopolysaccharide biosynthesis